MPLDAASTPETIVPLARSGEHLRDLDQLPASAAEPSQTVKEQVQAFLAHAELVGLSTVGSNGWPVSHCMHFASANGPQMRPVLYLFTHEHKRKLTNIQGNPRVGAFVLEGRSDGDPATAPSLKIQGLATQVTDPKEHQLAMECQFQKEGYEFARYLGLETQPALRIDVVSAVWQDPANGIAPVTVDYSDTFSALDAPEAA
ncbi:pyridoxamine 5'-phosphate oxidase family protein [Novosphingobium sp. RL4]|uniref:pyridoxamine 5'-phosphate oxidase family protein n=1 Tax=Novosphingobium sp. RL4 TaxID=3109595 RepID=UPI002D778E4E|nr:pyridoxamine 5'-phosphate oxidase family protein [Novosphingobium sp. RL4]WRT94415.1 pyridoxamine 5'-phosphate oxidase family protein [Novosphingobium sp. RL4]